MKQTFFVTNCVTKNRDVTRTRDVTRIHVVTYLVALHHTNAFQFYANELSKVRFLIHKHELSILTIKVSFLRSLNHGSYLQVQVVLGSRKLFLFTITFQRQ